MNEYDSNRIYDLATEINYKKTNSLKEADCYVLNTCHIREKATDKVYHDIGRLKKEFRNKKKPIVVVTGCVAQAEGEILLKREKYIDAVIGPQSYQDFKKTILDLERNHNKINYTEFEVIEKFDKLNVTKNSQSSVSSLLTIQEGCDKFCKFCVVPYTRGSEYSRSIKELIKEAKELVNNGAKEIILLGQNVNAFNSDGKKLSDLIQEISSIKDLKRIRYTTSHPIDFSEDLISAHGNSEKLMPLIHLPVQSGSSQILKKMNRKHSVDYYLSLIEKLKRKNSLIKFSSDFIIGYPGETDEDFNQTINVLKRVGFINSYSFIFSPRLGTPASQMKLLDNKICKDRLITFQKIAAEIKLKYRKGLFEKKAQVLFENRLNDTDSFFGRDKFNNSVIAKSKENLIGEIRDVFITSGDHNTLKGEILENETNREFAA
tara:strand:- start:160 stop:1455 length:1296 start_codon:yes stop_codon:yes gene_type:complete